MILTNDTLLSERAHLGNTNGIPAAPCCSSLPLHFTGRHCEANWKALSSLSGGCWSGQCYAVTELSAYSRTTPSSLCLGLLCAPSLIPDQVLWLRLTVSEGAETAPSPAWSEGPPVERRLGPGPHILFELTTQAEQPAYNLHSKGSKPH